MVIAIMSKLVKQRKESIKSYKDGGRQDLVDAEEAEVTFISKYLPAQMSSEDIVKAVESTISNLGICINIYRSIPYLFLYFLMPYVGATSVKDMGKVMGVLREQLKGRADISQVGEEVKREKKRRRI